MAPTGARNGRWSDHFATKFVGAGTCVALWTYGASVNAFLVQAAAQQGVLTGEEASVSLWDVVFLAHRLQPNHFATNPFGYAIFLVGSLLGGGDVFYGRTWKAIVMGAIPVLVFLLLTRRFRTPELPALLVAWLVPLQPGVAMFGFLAMEAGLETALGLAALYLALGPRRWQLVLSGGVLGATVLTYGAGTAFVLPVGVAWLAKAGRADSRRAGIGLVAGPAAAAVAVCALPFAWWTNTHFLLFGGGTLDATDRIGNSRQLLAELVVRGDSYYYFTEASAVAAPVALVGALGVVLTVRAWRRWWPLPLLLVGGMAVYTSAGGVVGTRRAVSIVVVLVCGCAVVGAVAFTGRPALRVAVTGMLLVLLVASATTLAGIHGDLARATPPLPRDFPFPTRPGESTEQALERLSRDDPANLRDHGYEPERTISMIMWQQRERPWDDSRAWRVLFDSWRKGQWCEAAPVCQRRARRSNSSS